MITTKDITPGFRFKVVDNIYEVLKKYNNYTVDLLNLRHNNIFSYEVQNIVDHINRGVYHIEPRVVKPLTYIEEL